MKNMKYKVLAADDEFWSRENIRNLIPWEEYSLEFLEPACDGEEVIERIAEEKPDIILTDINMPFLSGLELLQRLQNEYPEIITIAISGYDDFDKVKGVFVSGGLDYLLKPVGKEEMVKVLTKALGLLEERCISYKPGTARATCGSGRSPRPRCGRCIRPRLPRRPGCCRPSSRTRRD